ncbi:MAG: lytic transglycosylase F [Gammaproteobacteria bacterium]|nr:lytic transglycosylase F [Gammaproteobacteria bacterium]
MQDRLQLLAPIHQKFAGFLVFLWLCGWAGSASGQLTPEEQEALHQRTSQSVLGDPLENDTVRSISVLVDYSNTNFFIDETGRQRGFEHDLLKGYEKFLNRNVTKASARIFLTFIPMHFENILPALEEGLGDIAAAGLTITEQRQKSVDFAAPYIPRVDEIVVQHRNSPDIESLDDLAGKLVLVLARSSYAEHLKELNRRLGRLGRETIEIVEADTDLETADILELVNSGAVSFTVVDDYVARVWAGVFPDIVLRTELKLNIGGQIAWAVRKDSPTLKASLSMYARQVKKGTLLGNIAFERYFQNTRWIRNPLDPREFRKLEDVADVMKRYSDRFGWDWIAVAAQAYQESQLDQSKVSQSGAVGIMQLLPSTAAQKRIGIDDISTLENNIHAGVKYLVFLRNRYFSDPGIDPADRVDFSWAAYNAGPAKVQRLRKQARERGYDPNKWFGNVEHLAAEVIGRETVDYVANVNKYYVTYKFAVERNERRLNSN